MPGEGQEALFYAIVMSAYSHLHYAKGQKNLVSHSRSRGCPYDKKCPSRFEYKGQSRDTRESWRGEERDDRSCDDPIMIELRFNICVFGD